ncbi:MAG: hypothetical protein IJD21_03575 [Oscillospiraceae bacterium]|nr:hypothetical protein [Oscillospiraceae bacterium]
MKKLIVPLILTVVLLSACQSGNPGSALIAVSEPETISPPQLSEQVEEIRMTVCHCESDLSCTLSGIELDALRDWLKELSLEEYTFPDQSAPTDRPGTSPTVFSWDGGSFSCYELGEESYLLTEGRWYRLTEPSPLPVAIVEDYGQQRQYHMAEIDGLLYYDTGRTRDQILRCGLMDGEITSSVPGWETPTEEGQSNFGSGYGYQWGAGQEEVDLLINGHWHIFSLQPEETSPVAAP